MDKLEIPEIRFLEFDDDDFFDGSPLGFPSAVSDDTLPFLYTDEEQEVPTVENEKKDYITRNNKKYYKTDIPYVYRYDGNCYAYRIIHKKSGTNTFVTKHPETKQRFYSLKDAQKTQVWHLNKLDISVSYKNRKVTFGEIWEDIKRTSVREDATIVKYESIYKHHVSSVFGLTPLQEISFIDINNYLEKMYKMGDGNGTGQNGYSYSFVESILKFIWLIIQYGFGKKIISADDLQTLVSNIKMPKQIDSKSIRILSKSEIKKIYELLKDTDYLLVFLVSLYTAARPAEAFAIRFSDFDFKNNTLTINKQIVEFQGTLTFKEPKTFSRVVNIPYALKKEVKKRYDIIQTAKKENPHLFEINRQKVIYQLHNHSKGIDYIYDDMIMCDKSGRYNTHSSFQYYAKIIRKNICLNNDEKEDFSFYTFRKTAISIMASHSIPIGSLMRITGHKKNQTLFQYYYNDENEFAQLKVAEVVRSLETLI